MRIPNRKYRRNLVLYGILYSVWIVLLLGPLLVFPVQAFFVAGWVGIWAIVFVITGRSVLRMPSGIEVKGKEMMILLLRGNVSIPLDDIIDLKYNASNNRMSIVSMGSNHTFNDLGLDPEGRRELRDLAQARGWSFAREGKPTG